MPIIATFAIEYTDIKPLHYARKLMDENSSVLHVNDTLIALNAKHCNAYEIQLKEQLEKMSGYDYVLLIGPER